MGFLKVGFVKSENELAHWLPCREGKQGWSSFCPKKEGTDDKSSLSVGENQTRRSFLLRHYLLLTSLFHPSLHSALELLIYSHNMPTIPFTTQGDTLTQGWILLITCYMEWVNMLQIIKIQKLQFLTLIIPKLLIMLGKMFTPDLDTCQTRWHISLDSQICSNPHWLLGTWNCTAR